MDVGNRPNSVPGDIGVPVVAPAQRGSGGVAQVGADPSNPPAVSGTHGYPQPNKVALARLAFEPGAGAKIKEAKKTAFKPGADVETRMQAVQSLPALKQAQKAEAKTKGFGKFRNDAKQRAGSMMQGVHRSVPGAKLKGLYRSAEKWALKQPEAPPEGRVEKLQQGAKDALVGAAYGVSKFSASSTTKAVVGMSNVYIVITEGKKAVNGMVDNKRCAQLLEAGKSELAKIDRQIAANGATPELLEKKKIIEDGIKYVEARILQKNPEFSAKKAAVAGINLAHGTAQAAIAIEKFAGLVLPVAASIPVAGQLASAALLPVGAALAIDGLAACKSNLAQAKKDLKAVDGELAAQTAAREKMATFDELLKLVPTTNEAYAPLVKLNNDVKKAHQDLKLLDQELINDKMSKERVATIKRLKTEAHKTLDSSMKLATNLVAQPGLEQAHQHAKMQEVLIGSSNVMQTTVTPYLQQKLKTKTTIEHVRAVGGGIQLAGTAITGVGLVATAATAGHALPVVVAGIAVGAVGMTTTYGGFWFVEAIRHKQLGKDRVRSDTFDAALIGQMKKELAIYDSLPENMKSQSTIDSMYALIKKHDPKAPATAKEWASAIVNDGPKNPNLKNFKEARARMLQHDDTKGIIGSLTQRAVGKITEKFGKK